MFVFRRLASIPGAIGAALALTLVVAATVVASPTYQPETPYTLVTLKASGFTSNGDLVNGWYWLRNASQTAEWTFDVSALDQVMAVRGAKTNSVYLNVSALVTKGVNGASGYSGGLTLRYVGVKTVSSSIALVNPFRPRELSSLPINPTGGVGYAAYGASGVPAWGYRGAKAMKLVVSRANSSAVRDIHVAVNQDAALIAYVK